LHEVDEHSPLWGTDWAAPDERVISFIATMMGHDGTYAQTTYARHVYYCDDLRVGERFADIIHELPDGRMMIDYGLFHDTLADASATPDPA
jgi:inward rectifier potassium channel